MAVVTWLRVECLGCLRTPAETSDGRTHRSCARQASIGAGLVSSQLVSYHIPEWIGPVGDP